MDNGSVILQQRVGPSSPIADGSQNLYPTVNRFSSALVAGYSAEYEEYVSRGECYCACNQSVVTWGTVLTATAVTFTLYNPAGSPVDLVLLSTGITFAACSTAGSLVYAANVNNAAVIPATNTLLTVRNARLDGSGGFGIAYSVTTLPAAPVAIRTAAFGPVTATAATGAIVDDVKGGIVIGPNTAVTIQGITIVGTGLVSMLWRERLRIKAA
jgi:hypothetical protein